MRTIVWISRILFGAVFVFSGFVKAIDPLGSAYKFQDYFLAFGTEWMFPLALPLSVILSGLEFVIGAAVLLGLKMRYSAWGGLLFMAFFTPLTLYIAITDPVPDCGCFGDALIISNWDTFYKNIVILAAAIIIFIYRKKFVPLWSDKYDGYLTGAIALFVLSLSIYCLRHLPIIDFRPWKTGNDIREQMTPVDEEADVFFIFVNAETGETKEYPANDYPWDDPEWTSLWIYKDYRMEVTQPYVDPPITNFFIENEYGEELTEHYLFGTDPLLMVVAYDLNRTNIRSFRQRINPLALEAEKHGFVFIVLTAAGFDAIETFRHENQTPYPFYQTDAIALKTIVRSNPGLLLLKEGIVLGKWAHRDIPGFESIKNLVP